LKLSIPTSISSKAGSFTTQKTWTGISMNMPLRTQSTKSRNTFLSSYVKRLVTQSTSVYPVGETHAVSIMYDLTYLTGYPLRAKGRLARSTEIYLPVENAPPSVKSEDEPDATF
jgi:hypothetical protein